MKQKKGSYLLGILGAFLGMLLAMVPFVIVYFLGYIIFWLSFLFVVLTAAGYDKLNGRQGWGKIPVVLLFSTLGLVLGIFSEDIWFLATEYVNDYYGLKYWEIPAVIWDILKEDAEYRRGRLVDLALSFGVMMIGMVSMIVHMVRGIKAAKNLEVHNQYAGYQGYDSVQAGQQGQSGYGAGSFAQQGSEYAGYNPNQAGQQGQSGYGAGSFAQQGAEYSSVEQGYSEEATNYSTSQEESYYREEEVRRPEE